MALFERDDIIEALAELAHRLADAGVSAGIRVLGGAALSIEHFDRGVTHDVDALLSPADDIRTVSRALAAERGWPEDWLNNKVKMYASDYPERATWTTLVADGDVVVSVASADLLLAMKLKAVRGRRDSDDITELLRICDVTSIGEALAIWERFYPYDPIPDKASAQLKARFPAGHEGVSEA